MEEQKRILEELILNDAPYEEILRQSQVVDELIVAHMKGGE